MNVDLIAILDRSGSMGSMESDVIKSFNKFIDDQKKLPGDAFVTLVLFNGLHSVVHNRSPIHSVLPLTEKTYVASGTTALHDAVGRTLKAAESAQKAIVFIFTDGIENSSREYNKEQVKAMVQARERAGWEVHFIGAEIDAFATGCGLGIRQAATMQTTRDKKGIAQYSCHMSENSSRFRADASK